MNSSDDNELDLTNQWEVMLHQATISPNAITGSLDGRVMRYHNRVVGAARNKLVLSSLVAAGRPLTVTELAKASNVSRHQVFRTLENLVSSGHIEKQVLILKNNTTKLILKLGPKSSIETCQETVQ